MSSRRSHVVLRGVAALWRGVAQVVGGVAGWKPSVWHSPGAQRVLVVAPHPDDEIGCGGTLLLHGRAGDEIHLVHVTDGRMSRAGGLGPEQMAYQRKLEAAAAARALGCARGETHWLGLREWEWEDAALVPALRDRLRETRPHVVYAPSCVDFHPEHVRVARCLAQALADVRARDLTVRVYQIQVPLTALLVNLIAPLHAVVQELLAAMQCYASQWGSVERCLRMKRYCASFYACAGLAEEFWQLDADGYRRVHAGSAGAGANGAFRGMRARPFTDPLSYLRGLRARRHLRAFSQRR